MNKKTSMVIGVIILLIGQVAVFAQDEDSYSYFHIRDLAHDAYLGAGNKYDMDLYHYQVDKRTLPQNAQWRFEDAGKIGGKQYYYIVDRLHSSAITGGMENVFRSQGQTSSLKDYSGRQNSRWTAKVLAVKNDEIPVIFTDQKHKLNLIAGSNFDGQIYHQSGRDKLNARWVLELVEKGKKGPDFYVVEQRLVSLIFNTDDVSAIKHPPTLTLKDGQSNYSDVNQSYTVNKTVEHTAEEFWSLEKSVKASVYQSISISSGFAGSEVKSEITFGLEYGQKWVTSDKRITKNALTWNIPVVAPPHTRIEVSAVIKVLKRDVGFTATIESTMANGKKVTDEIDGEWDGVQYVTGEIRFDQEEL